MQVANNYIIEKNQIRKETTQALYFLN